MQEKPLRILLVEDNPGDARLVQEMLMEAEGSEFDVHSADTMLAALNALSKGNFDVALVDLSLPDCQGAEIFTTIQAHAPDLPIVVLTGLDSESMATEAMHSGVQDYLFKGRLSSDALVRALHFAVLRQSKSGTGGPDTEKAALIGFLSAKGGVGATTIATHFAVALKQQTNQKVLLADLDVSSSAAGFLLGVNSPHTMHEVATNLHRLDIQFWGGVVCPTSKGIDLLQSPGAIQYAEELNPERVRHVLRFARSLYRYIVVDLGKITSLSMSLLPELHDLYVITNDELPALYEANRLVKRLVDLGLKRDHLRLVLNRLSKSAAASPQDMERALGYLFYAVLPDVREELQEAYAAGRFLHEGLHLRKEIDKFVSKSLGVAIKTPALSGLNLFRFGRSQPQPQ